MSILEKLNQPIGVEVYGHPITVFEAGIGTLGAVSLVIGTMLVRSLRRHFSAKP